MRLVEPESWKVQQGAIFNCVAVPGYGPCACSGVVLTARCDLAHGKQSVVNYLPIVPFSGWAQREMCCLLAKRMRTEQWKGIDDALERRGVSEQVRATFPLQDVILNATTGKEQTRLLKALSLVELAEDTISSPRTYYPRSSALIKGAGKLCDGLIDELVKQKLSGFYFLERTSIFDESPEGSVVLLRHMRTVETPLMELIARGISAEEASRHEAAPSHITFDHEPFCMITGVLRSPDIEHLAQTFASLFTRIGLVDQSRATIAWHIEAAKGGLTDGAPDPD